MNPQIVEMLLHQKQKKQNKFTKIWGFLNGNKTLIGLTIFFVVDHLLPPYTWYTDLLIIIAYALTGLGLTHKAVKYNRGRRG